MKLKRENKKCVIVDLDIVNPYFRAADFKNLFSDNDIDLTVSKYANSNLDIPSLSFDLESVVSDTDKHVIIDVGGDDAGATALGRFRTVLEKLHANGELDMFYVVNYYRYLTREPDEALEFLRSIEAASGIACTGIINNSNLGVETDYDIIKASLAYAEKLKILASLPIVFTSGKSEILNNSDIPNAFPIDMYVKII